MNTFPFRFPQNTFFCVDGVCVYVGVGGGGRVEGVGLSTPPPPKSSRKTPDKAQQTGVKVVLIFT